MKKIGKVIEIFIPEEYKNGILLDIMDRTLIGFKVLYDNNINTYICKMNDKNSLILKDDLVIIKDNQDIELYDGEEDE